MEDIYMMKMLFIYILNYIPDLQRIMEVKDLFQNLMAPLEEYREWISEGINQDYVVYLISQNQISQINWFLVKVNEINSLIEFYK